MVDVHLVAQLTRPANCATTGVLQQVVDAFVNARPAAIDVARRAAEATDQQKKPGKRKRTVVDSDDVEQAEQEKRTTRSKSRRIAASQTSQPESIEIVDSDGDEDGDYEPEKVQDDGLVECPARLWKAHEDRGRRATSRPMRGRKETCEQSEIKDACE